MTQQAEGLPMQVRRIRITSSEWEMALPANPHRKFLRIGIGQDLFSQMQGMQSGAIPSVKVALDAPGDHYGLAWILKPFEPSIAPTNAVYLRAMNLPQMPGVEMVAFVDILEG